MPDDAQPTDHLNIAATEAARYLRAVVNGDERNPHYTRVDAAKYIVDQHLGKAKQKGELPAGGNLLYFQLIMLIEKGTQQPKVIKQVTGGEAPLEPQKTTALVPVEVAQL